MTAIDLATRRVQDSKISNRQDVGAIIMLWVCIFFNFALAIANAHGMALSGTKVAIIQGAITACVAIMLFARKFHLDSGFTLAIVTILIGCCLTSFYRGNFDYVKIYNVLLIPIFIMLGSTIRKLRTWHIGVPFGATLLVAAVEAAASGAYEAIVNPLAYYRQTRSWVGEQYAAQQGDVGLYVGAHRAGGRALAMISESRVGSVFLEPLSLGYFACLCAMFFVARYRGRPIILIPLLAACLSLSLAADSRSASALIGLFGILATARIPISRLWLIISPVGLFALLWIIYAALPVGTGGDLYYRLGLTYGVISETSFWDLAFGGISTLNANDSGLVTLLGTSGIFAPLAIYAMTGMFQPSWIHERLFALLAVIYATVTLTFGGAVFSIKTASLFGVLVGVASKGGLSERGMSAQRRRPLDDRILPLSNVRLVRRVSA